MNLESVSHFSSCSCYTVINSGKILTSLSIHLHTYKTGLKTIKIMVHNLEVPLVKFKTRPYRGRARRPKEEADHSRSAGGRFSKPGNLHTRLVLGWGRMSRSLHPPARILKVYIRRLNRIQSDDLNNTLLSEGFVHEPPLTMGMEVESTLPRQKRGQRSLPLPRPSSWVHQQLHPLNELLQQGNTPILSQLTQALQI